MSTTRTNPRAIVATVFGNATTYEVPGDASSVTISLSGVAGGASLDLFGTVDGTNWAFFSVQPLPESIQLPLNSLSANGIYRAAVGGFSKIKLSVGSPGTGTITVSANFSDAPPSNVGRTSVTVTSNTAPSNTPVTQSISNTLQTNAIVAVQLTNTALVAARASSLLRRVGLKNTGATTVNLGFGATATTAMWPLVAGETQWFDTKLAINGITITAPCNVAVLEFLP